jgi:hypothetical protein
LIIMTALPKAAAQAAAVTAVTRDVLLQALVEHSAGIKLLSSPAICDAGGMERKLPVPTTRAASALLTVLMPCALEKVAEFSVTPGRTAAE